VPDVTPRRQPGRDDGRTPDLGARRDLGQPRHRRRLERRAAVERGKRLVGATVGHEDDVLHRVHRGIRPRDLCRRSGTSARYRRRVRRAGVVGVIVAFALAACSSNDHRATSRSSVAASSSTSSSTTSTTTPTDLAAVHLTLTKVADAPRATATAVRTGDPALYVAEQGGLLVALRDGRVDPVFDLTSRVTSSGEHGLLGIAFSPDGTKLYVHFSAAGSGATTLEEYAFNDGRVDPATRRLVLTVPDLQANHNGGQLAFGPDGNL